MDENFRTRLSDSRDGICCPTCDRYAKIYNRKLNSSMVRALLWFYREYVREGEARWIHVATEAPRWMLQSGEFAKLKFWKFLLEHANTDETKRNSGRWCLSQKGADFAEGKVSANARVIVYDDKIIEWDKTQVTVQDALGRHYSYPEIMRTGCFDRG